MAVTAPLSTQKSEKEVKKETEIKSVEKRNISDNKKLCENKSEGKKDGNMMIS